MCVCVCTCVCACECSYVLDICICVLVIVYVMDARELHQFKDKSFTLVIDKGLCDMIYLRVWCGKRVLTLCGRVGCLDAICCGMNLYESSKRYCEVHNTVLQSL
jgi:hypothetical protein